MISSKKEFNELLKFVKGHKCTTELQVRDAVELYFDNIIWSILKEEYLKLTDHEREVLFQKLLKGQRLKRGMGTN